MPISSMARLNHPELNRPVPEDVADLYRELHDQTGVRNGSSWSRFPVKPVSSNSQLQAWREVVQRERSRKKNWYINQAPAWKEEYKGRAADAVRQRTQWPESNNFFRNVGTVDELRLKKSASTTNM